MIIEDIISLCDRDFADERESRKITDVTYYVIDWQKVGLERLSDKLITLLSRNFVMDKTRESVPTIFFVFDRERNLFFVGSWDILHHAPYSPDPKDKRNNDLSEYFSLTAPRKQAKNST